MNRRCHILQRARGAALCLGVSMGLALASVAVAQESDPHANHRKMLQQTKQSESKLILPDTELVTQHGDRRRLGSEIVDGRIVVIDFIYTTCTTVCPVLSATLRQVQRQLEEGGDSEVMLVSITVDPVRDTPARLKAYADKFHVGDNWVWLTGDKQAVDGVLKQLGAYSPNYADHPSMVLVGDAAKGDWARYLGFPSADQIITKVEELSTERRRLSVVGSR
jgi:protein SCO1/2